MKGQDMPRKKIRPIRIDGDVAYITLTKGYVAIIDAADVPIVDGFNWHAVCHYRRGRLLRSVYAGRNDGYGGRIYLHRAIMDPPDDMEVDHIDGDGLNNKRDNMRMATHQQNSKNLRIRCDNTSGIKGVTWRRDRRKWRAKITINRNQKSLGLFTCIHEAAAAYAAASEKMHGEWGRTE